jgi:pectate lyase
MLIKILQLIVLIGILFFPKYSNSQQLAFPGAMGFGKYSIGGRGGEIVTVSNLNDSGVGSLREALSYDFPRIVVFTVAGNIKLHTPIVVNTPYLSLYGHTAPGDGIVISGNSVVFSSHDVIVRFIRFRPGDLDYGPPNLWGSMDAISIKSGEPDQNYNLIFDHCSFSWSTDELVGIWDDARDITIQNSILSEPLNSNLHPKGGHAFGLLTGERNTRISIIRNLFAHNFARNPWIAGFGHFEVLSNIVYNPGGMALQVVSYDKNANQTVAVINNKFIEGPNSYSRKEVLIWRKYLGKILIQNNLGFNKKTDQKQFFYDWNTTGEQLDFDLYSYSDSNYVNSLPQYLINNEDVDSYIKDFGGAFLPIRDQVDRRAVSTWLSRTGKIIQSQKDEGGFPEYLYYPRVTDMNKNGVCDEWETKYGITNSINFSQDIDFDGFTNIEEYINNTDPTIYEDFSSDDYLISLAECANNSSENDDSSYVNSLVILKQTKSVISLNYISTFDDKIELKLYTSDGRLVRSYSPRYVQSGYNRFDFPVSNMSNGVYFLQLINSRSQISKKILLLN